MTFTNEDGQQITSVVLVGENNVRLLDGRTLGISQIATHVGNANEWLKKGIFERLGAKK